MALYTITTLPGTVSCQRRLLPARVFFYVLLFFFLFLSSLTATAAPPQSFVIKNPHTEVVKNRLFARLSVSVDDEEGLRNMLKDGAVLALGIGVDMERLRSWWGNEEIVSTEFVSTILHDPLTRDFLVVIPSPDGEKQRRDKNLTRLLHSTWRDISIPLLSLERLRINDVDSTYSITLSLTLQHTEVPPWLEKSLVFWSSDVVPPEKINLSYVLPEANP